jgi:hypothetical protein
MSVAWFGHDWAFLFHVATTHWVVYGWRWEMSLINRMDPLEESLEFDHGGRSKRCWTTSTDPDIDSIIPRPAQSPLIWSKSPDLSSNVEWRRMGGISTTPHSASFNSTSSTLISFTAVVQHRISSASLFYALVAASSWWDWLSCGGFGGCNTGHVSSTHGCRVRYGSQRWGRR